MSTSFVTPSCSPSLPRWTFPAPPDATIAAGLAAAASVSPELPEPETSLSARAGATLWAPGAMWEISEASMLLTSNPNHQNHQNHQILNLFNKYSTKLPCFVIWILCWVSFLSSEATQACSMRSFSKTYLTRHLAQCWGTWWLQKGSKPMQPIPGPPWVRGVRGVKGSICIDKGRQSALMSGTVPLSQIK